MYVVSVPQNGVGEADLGKRRPRFAVNIGTLDPSKLCSDDIIELSGLMVKIYDRHCLARRSKSSNYGSVWRLRPAVVAQDAHISIHFSRILRGGDETAFIYMPFPPDIRGWLYYHRPPHRPAIAGEIRFRRLPDGGAHDFNSGTDLALSNGVPYVLPLMQVAPAQGYTMLQNMLLRDNLVDSSLMEHCIAIRREIGLKGHKWRSAQFVFSLEDPFILNLAQQSVDLHIWVNDKVYLAQRIVRRCCVENRGGILCIPYTGESNSELFCTHEAT